MSPAGPLDTTCSRSFPCLLFAQSTGLHLGAVELVVLQRCPVDLLGGGVTRWEQLKDLTEFSLGHSAFKVLY